ncbi:nucleolar protein 8 [Xenopus laevis]|uniref:Nucleolar protein 8 n=2 Tax=Xenopus laevis TaxID=8355 RepID=A0A1L8GP17_XENLA|nr:nucleolar protein 8 [Xenopus laevis]XP_018114413.1 nucleolar protein 8 [Xenopus laevis]XP_018114414.1 nucleolar protein 8 [Xenopus laevis]XP_018114415.1 nucleolar protein 8 [Xenopus laevis]XP_018114416.1 nucleolar protein 8 [Xenopus laevis]XP_018114418.1 nucleolar protein 8 [Xenopus laevis]XP_041446680.1 nucleolar protein 8 [Xenopus laevis]OCT85595.1 hypothetical protein XELAEV_18023764mg [Xenopus laevis]
MEASLKRLYVGGIGSSVTDSELTDRFGKFGKVNDVDIISRKDEQGNPVKTFAYLNINISETDLKKCMSTLNKTKWKGGVLQIEIAKESFLHRLAQERQEAKDRSILKAEPKEELVQSLQQAGVKDFQMKAAVPGTEVPNHKNWVVSKFGRVLPILHLKDSNKKKITKYDPSKYCHNIKKLEDTSLEMTPISQLTWHLEGGDDDISRKRRGEFPATKSPSNKKPKMLKPLNTKEPNEKTKGNIAKKSILSVTKESPGTPRNAEVSGIKQEINMHVVSKKKWWDESDSEEEMRTILEREKNEVKVGPTLATDSNLEIVDNTFKLRYNTHWGHREESTSKGSQPDCSSKGKDDDEYDSADTDEIISVAKTVKNVKVGSEVKENALAIEKQFLLAQKQKSNHGSENKKSQKERPKESNSVNENDDLGSESSDSYSDEEYDSLMQNCQRVSLTLEDLTQLASAAKDTSEDETIEEEAESNEEREEVKTPAAAQRKKNGINPDDILASLLEDDDGSSDEQLKGKRKKEPPVKLPAFKRLGSLLVTAPEQVHEASLSSKSNFSDSGSDSGNQNDDLGSESSDSYSDEEYDSLMQNCHRLTLTLEDLTQLASAAKETSEDEAAEEEAESSKSNQHEDVKSSAATQRNKKSGTTPDEIVASLLEEDDSSSDEQPKRKRKKETPVKLPAFKGLGSLLGTAPKQELDASLNSKSDLLPSTSSTVKNKTCETDRCNTINTEVPKKTAAEKSVQDLELSKSQKKGKVEVKQSSSSESSSESSSDESSTSSSSSAIPAAHTMTQKSKSNEQVKTSAQNSEALKLQDNKKRLAAMEERRKEREQQKQAIKGALLKQDSQPSSKGKHIVFDSEADSEEDDKVTLSTNAMSKPTVNEQSKTTKLFESSDDESKEDDKGSDDADRFQIKSQYEGRSGEKLMQLQSRFGTDERFKMDSRFLDSNSEDEEEEETSQKTQADKEGDELSAEKKKNLNILQSLLNINVEQPPVNKQAAKAKKFKDLNTLQYDPTREDHAAFEAKSEEEEKKESKAQRKKKRLEAEKIPEVSAETYHEVAIDFKEVFGASKPDPTTGTAWDQEEEIEGLGEESSAETQQFSFLTEDKEEPSGFTFSFFDAGNESVSKDETYKIETIKPAKVAWQEDPRFQDSSSEGEDDDEPSTGKESKISMETKTPKSTMRFFFFVKDDERLKEGPKMFFQSSKLTELEEAWEQRRDYLLEECKKRHKDAKRKVKAKY